MRRCVRPRFDSVQIHMTTTNETPLETFTDQFTWADGCCLHDPLFRPADVEKVIGIKHTSGYYAESETTAVVKLKDGRYGLFTASEDTTGHGCQCGAMTVVEDTLHSLVAHLTVWELERFLTFDERNFDGDGSW